MGADPSMPTALRESLAIASEHADLLGSLVELVACGGCTTAVEAALRVWIQKAMIAASDAEMEREYPDQK